MNRTIPRSHRVPVSRESQLVAMMRCYGRQASWPRRQADTNADTLAGIHAVEMSKLLMTDAETALTVYLPTGRYR